MQEHAMLRLFGRGCTAALVALASIGCLGVACAEPGVTDTEIRIGMWTPLSGPVALLGQSARDAVRLWAKEINEKGDIHGRKINFIFYDDAGSPQEAQTAVRRL